MPYGRFLDYTPIDIKGTPAYEFTRTDGPPVTFYGDEAEDLRARLDAAKAAGPQPTAEVAPIRVGTTTVERPTAPESKPDVAAYTLKKVPGLPIVLPHEVTGEEAGLPEPVMDPEQAARMQGPPKEEERIPEQQQQQGMTPAEAARYPKLAEQYPGAQHTGGEWFDVGEGHIARERYYPGTRGESHEQQQAAAKLGTETPISTRTRIEGAVPRDPEIEEGYLEASAWQRDKLEEAREIAIQNAVNEEEIRRAEVQRSTAAVRAQQEAVALQQAKLQEYEQIRNRARAEYKAGRVDPSRLFKGEGGTLRALGAAIAAGAGAFGATLGRTQNYAQQAIEASIDRDIRAQEEEIRVKGDAADNAMKDFMAQGLTVEQSKLLLTELMRDHVKSNAELMASEGLIDRTDIKYQQLLAQHDIRTLDIQRQWQREATGNATREVASQMRYPVAGTPGRRVIEYADTGQTQETLKTEAYRQKLYGTGGKGKSTADMREIAGVIAELETHLGDIDQYVPKNAPADRTDEENRLNESPLTEAQSWPTRKWREFQEGYKPGSVVRGMDPAEQVRHDVFLRTQFFMMNQTSKLQGQGVIRKHEEEMYRKQVASAQTAESIQRIGKMMIRGATARLEAMKAAGVPTMDWSQFEKQNPEAAKAAEFDVLGGGE